MIKLSINQNIIQHYGSKYIIKTIRGVPGCKTDYSNLDVILIKIPAGTPARVIKIMTREFIVYYPTLDFSAQFARPEFDDWFRIEKAYNKIWNQVNS